MPIQPTQADLDDYERRMELMRQRKPVYWGPDANAYSYERHVREEQEAQDRREREVLAGRGGRRQDSSADQMEAALAERLGMPAPQNPPQRVGEESDGPARQNLPYRIGEESEGPARQNLPQRIGPGVPGQQERHRENLSQFDQQPREQGNAGLMAVPSGPAPAPAPSARERYESMSPYDKWIHRMMFGEPGVSPPRDNPSGMKVELDLPGPLGVLQEPLTEPPYVPDAIDEAVSRIKKNNPIPSGPQRRVPSQETQIGFDSQARKADLARWEREKEAHRQFMADAEAGRRQAIAERRPKELDQPSRLRAMLNRDPLFEALVGQRDRLRNETQVDKDGESDVTRRFKEQPEPTWRSPEEKMEDAHTAMQRALSGRNTEAREARRGYRPPSEDFSNARIAQGLQQRLTGQVDELSNADGRLGAMQAANDRARAKEQAENSQYSASMQELFRMQDERKAKAKAEGKPNPMGVAIGPRRVAGTDDGHGRERYIGGVRQQFIKDREAARKNAVNAARTATLNGEKYKAKLTGNPKIDQYAQGAASSIQRTTAEQADKLKRQLIAADAASGGKLGYINKMQEAAAAAAAAKAQGKESKQKAKADQASTEKANEFTSKQNELNRQNELEKARIMAGGRGGNEPNVSAIKSAMEAASFTLMKPDATPSEVAEARRIISEGQRALNGAAGIPNAPAAPPKTVEEEQAEARQDNTRTRVITSKTPDVAASNALQALDAGTLTESQAFVEAGKYGPQAVQRLRELLADRRNITEVRSAVGGMY